jgi:hypothetical protein
LTTWVHVACRVSGSDRRIFINGNTDNFTTVAGPAATDTQPVTIAKAPFHDYWDGRIDDVRLYTRALSNADIAAIAAGGQGPNAPTSLTASPGASSVTLNWLGSATFYNVKRSTVSATGPFTTIASNVTAQTFNDTGLTAGMTYYYVVSGVTYGEGPNSAPLTVTPAILTALPNSGLFTSEAGTTTTFNVRLNLDVPGTDTVMVTVTSNDVGEGLVSTTLFPTPAASFTVPVAGPQTAPITIPVTVTGQPDSQADPNVTYTISVSSTCSTNSTFDLSTPPVSVTNNNTDIAIMTFSQTTGLQTTESGGAATVVVTLTTQPVGQITLNLTNMNPGEITVNPSSVILDASNWNTQTAQFVITGVDDALLDFTQPWSVVPQPLIAPNDSAYVGMVGPTVTGINLDNEVIPPAPGAWGGSGGGGGCGLLGLELLLPLLVLRRRRSRS